MMRHIPGGDTQAPLPPLIVRRPGDGKTARQEYHAAGPALTATMRDTAPQRVRRSQ